MKVDDENKIFIHVGLPRTGTKFLQQHIFPNMNVNFVGRITHLIPTVSALICSNYMKNTINLFSDEGLSSYVCDNAIRDTRENITHRIKTVFPNAKIIVVFREKEDWMESMYYQFCKGPKRTNLIKDFDDYKNKYIPEEALDFSSYEKILKKLFDDVLVLQYEDLKNNANEFVADICNFVGVDIIKFENRYVNRRWNERKLKVYNRLARTKPAYVMKILRDVFDIL